MCETSPAARLSWLIEQRTGARIPAPQLKAFIKSDWEKLKVLAHAIHDEPEPKPVQRVCEWSEDQKRWLPTGWLPIDPLER